MNVMADECLPIGTPVIVKGTYGTVIESGMKPAYPTGMIAVHKITLTHKAVRGFGNRVVRWVPMEKPKTKEVHHSFIFRVEEI